MRQNPILYEIFQINQPNGTRVVKVQRNTPQLETFEKKIITKPITNHKRAQSSFFDKREEKYSVVIESKIVTKKEINLLKFNFDKVSKTGSCQIKQIYPVLVSLGYKLERIFDPLSVKEVSFYDLLQLLFSKASRNQLLRLLRFVGDFRKENFESKIDKKVNMLTIQPKTLSTYKKMFEKYDTNSDGVIDLKELKHALDDVFSEETIEKLFNTYKKHNHGLNFLEFVRLYAPKNIELPDYLFK